jgi:hypothetical protein
MSKGFKNGDAIEQIMGEMHQSVVGALINAQLTKDNSVKNAVEVIRPTFDKFSREDILDSFIVFALNVAADSLATKDSQKTGEVEAKDVVMAKPGQA